MPAAASNQNASVAPNNNPFAIVKLKEMAWYILPVVKKTKITFVNIIYYLLCRNIY